MNPQRALRPILFAAGLALAGIAGAHGVGESVQPKFERAIPNHPGKKLVALEVSYAPGGASLPHVHAKSAFIYAYVLSGSIASKVNDGPERVYKAGEGFHEDPGSSHPVSRNASKTLPAKLLAIVVVDADEQELTTNAQ